jgi:hypothetical protein
MLSKDAKVEYLCEHCNNPEITRIKMYGQDSYECLRCRRWFAWKTRKVIPAGEKYMLREDYMFMVGIAIGLIVAGMIAVFLFNFTETRFQFFKWFAVAVMGLSVSIIVWVNLKFRGIV